MSYFETHSLCVGYNGTPLIRDIDLSVEKGEIAALIGPNGAGKSTILKTIARELPALSGNIVLDGKDLRTYSHRELAQKLAVVLTERLRPELMSCHDVVATGRYPYTGRLGILRREDEDKVDEALAAVHAESLGVKDFNAVSDGERQRIMLARAICQEPEIILLDEPTSYLDVRYKLELLSILTRMARKKGITVLVSLHEIDLAEKAADRVICVKGERLFANGRPEEVFEASRIRSLYEIEKGSFDPLFGSIELQRPHGKKPKVFVLAGGGCGIPVFRQMQRENTPFAAGILAENDMDYPVARDMAAVLVTEKAFEPIGDAAFAEARALIESCERVIDAGVSIGTVNGRMAELMELASQSGKLERR